MALTGQNHGVYRSKVWHFWVVTHGVLATPDNKTFATRDNGQQTTDNGQAVAGGALQELRNYGTTDRAKPAHSSWLTAHDSQLKKNNNEYGTYRNKKIYKERIGTALFSE